LLIKATNNSATGHFTWKNVDLERCEIHVVQQLTRQEKKGQRLVFGHLKTKYSRRTIKIGDDLVELLKAYHLSQQKYKQLMGTRWKEHDLVFPLSVGTRWINVTCNVILTVS
jgi:hypothetical protein